MSAPINEKDRTKEELEALEVAEDSRETEWQKPSFMADLFMGKFSFNSIYPFPEQDEEDRKIGDRFIDSIRPYFENEHDDDEIDRERKISDETWRKIASLGLFGLKIPKEYGGQGLSQTNYDRVLAFVARYCSSTVATLSAHQSIGLPMPLLLFGTKEQKEKYLPEIAKGAISAFALTEPEVGSDPAKMSTTATPTEDGNHYLLNGEKLWCTNSVIARYLIVMALTPAKVVRGKERKQITAFIMDTKSPGFKIQHRCEFMGLNGIENGYLKFENVKVPKENIVWGPGKGLKLALTTLNVGRLSLPAVCVGGSRYGLEVARKWSAERQQWGTQIGKHEASANKLATMSANLLAMDAITWLACAWVDRKSHDIRLEAAMAKVFCSVKSHEMCDELIQLRGGRGYETRSSLRARGESIDAPVERMYRDSRINQIVEGTSEIMRLFIAREALDRHLRIAGDVLNPRASIGTKLKTLVRAGFFYLYWYPRQWITLCYWPLCSHLGKNGRHMRYVARTSHKLARTTFHQMLRYGPRLEKKQMQLMRLVEIATDLFAMAATVSRAASLAKRSSENQSAIDSADLFCRQARARIRDNFRSICCNSDDANYRLARRILNEDLLWQEKAD